MKTAKTVKSSNVVKSASTKKTTAPVKAIKKVLSSPIVAKELKNTPTKSTTKKTNELKVTPPPTPPVPKVDSKLVKKLTQAGFFFQGTAPTQSDEAKWLHGYAHADGRVAVYACDVYGGNEEWHLQTADGVKVAAGTSLPTLVANLKSSKPVPTSDFPMPAKNIIRAVQILGGLTLQSYELTVALKGPKQLEHRITLLKKIFNVEAFAAKDATLPTLVEAFYTALEVPAGNAKEFVTACKRVNSITTKQVSAATRRQAELETEAKRKASRDNVVPGPVPLPGFVKPRREDVKQRNLELAKTAAAAPKRPDSEVVESPVQAENRQRVQETKAIMAVLPAAEDKADPLWLPAMTCADVALLEHTMTGLVLLRLERCSSQGAVCIYNDGSRVAAGLVTAETLTKFRKIENADVVTAARQLLNPITSTVQVTPVAIRHLTAVMNCKELKMATATVVPSTTKKFAAPSTAKSAKAPKEETKTTKAKSEPAKAAKGKAAPTKKAAKPVKDKEAKPAADKKIKALTTKKEGNTCRAESFCWYQVDATVGSKTVAEAQAKLDASGGNPNSRRLEVAWLAKKGFIEVL